MYAAQGVFLNLARTCRRRPFIKVYVQTNVSGNIIRVDKATNIDDLTGWIFIDEGEGDRYRLAQNNYFPLPLYDDYGVCRYKLVNGQPVERTAEEMEADRPEEQEPEEPEETIEDLTLEMLADHEYRLCLIEIEM